MWMDTCGLSYQAGAPGTQKLLGSDRGSHQSGTCQAAVGHDYVAFAVVVD